MNKSVTKSRICPQLENTYKRYQQNPLIPQYKPRLSEVTAPPPLWHVFYKQHDAIEHSRKLNEETFVFAVENHFQTKEKKGCRHFIVSSLEEFWFYYINLPADKRHFYEVIQADSACHLYFDLEFNKVVNPDKNGFEMVETFIEYICACLFNCFGIHSSRENVLALDSTTDTKFSQHLIWHCRNCVFSDNKCAGYFVNKTCQGLMDYIRMSPVHRVDHWLNRVRFSSKLPRLVVAADDGSLELFVDQGVYTKNRNFRLFLSSKSGKSAVLRLARNCLFNFKNINPLESCCAFHLPSNCRRRAKVSQVNTHKHFSKDKLVFLASLVTNVRFNASVTVLEVPGVLRDRPSTAVAINSHDEHLPRSASTFASCKACCAEPTSLPFTALKQFVTDLVRQHNDAAGVKNWTYFASSQVIVYDVEGTRYCCNVRREHKSNRIMLVADLNAHCCYQKCYDPVCRQSDYKSPPIPFPQSVIESLSSNSWESVDDDEAFLSEVEAVERNMAEHWQGVQDGVSDEELLMETRAVERTSIFSQCSVSDKELIQCASLMEKPLNCDDISDTELAVAIAEYELIAYEDVTDACLTEALASFEDNDDRLQN